MNKFCLENKLQLLSELTSLVQKYIDTDINYLMQLVLDLYDLLELFYNCNISIKEFRYAVENNTVKLPEHWQQRTKFLDIVLRYCNTLDYKFYFQKLNTYKLPIITKIDYSKIQIVKFDNEFEEIEYVIKEITQNSYIVCPNRKIRELLSIRFQFENFQSENFQSENFQSENFQSKNFNSENLDSMNFGFMNLINSDNFKNKIEQYFSKLTSKLVTSKLIANKLYKKQFETSQFENNVFNKLFKILSDLVRNDKLIDLKSLDKIKSPDKIFCMSMNLKNWIVPRPGCLWLHVSLYNRLRLPVYHVNLNTILQHNVQTYLLYSTKFEQRLVKKSSILTLFEAEAKKRNINLQTTSSNINDTRINNTSDNNTCIDNTCIDNTCTSSTCVNNTCINDTELVIENFEFPSILYGDDIKSILHDFKSFYIKRKLKVDKVNDNSIISNFRETLYCFFKQLDFQYYMSQIKKIDEIYYHKCIQIINWLQKYHNTECYNTEYCNTKCHNLEVLNNTKTECNISDKLLITHSDRIEISDNELKIIRYQLSSTISTKNILSGKETSLLAQSLALRYKFNKHIKFEIWCPNWHGTTPITIKEIDFDNNVIDDFYKLVTEKIDFYNTNQSFIVLPSENYKHFERN